MIQPKRTREKVTEGQRVKKLKKARKERRGKGLGRRELDQVRLPQVYDS